MRELNESEKKQACRITIACANIINYCMYFKTIKENWSIAIKSTESIFFLIYLLLFHFGAKKDLLVTKNVNTMEGRKK